MAKKLVGFFSGEDLEDMGGQDPDGPRCQDCGLYKRAIHPKMKYTGEGRKKCLIIAEAPGEVEDQTGIQLKGPVGQLQRKFLKEYGLDLDKDFWKINAVNCRPVSDKGGNREPTDNEISCCRPMLLNTIEELKPTHIWLLGKVAIKSFFKDKFSVDSLAEWRGLTIPDRDSNAWVCPMAHPSFMHRNEGNQQIEVIYREDLQRAVEALEWGPFDHVNVMDYVEILTNPDDICAILDRIIDRQPEWLSFDYETTGKKPFNNGHKIATISVCFQLDRAFAFPYQYRDMFSQSDLMRIKRRWRAIMQNPNIKKVAHSKKFEDIWTRKIMGCRCASLDFCTQMGSHIIANKPGTLVTGLKFLGYANYGIFGYDKNIEPYLKTKPNGHLYRDDFNRVMEAPLDQLLIYNAVDSLLGYWEFIRQREDISQKENLQKAFDFSMKGLSTFADIQYTGIPSNLEYYLGEYKKAGAEIAALQKRMEQSEEAQKFQEKYGKKINFGSSPDIRKLLTEVYKVKLTKRTEKGNFAVDKTVLSDVKLPVIKDQRKLAALKKVQGTYFAQFVRETNDDGRIHPFFDLHVPVTYRSSSKSPNWQNIPNRDEEDRVAVRSGIFPSEGHQILDWDYGAQEFRIYACYAEDPVMIKYIEDPRTDIHRDMAMQLFLLKQHQVTKQMRQVGKNAYVFPTLYGSYWQNTAPAILSDAGDLEIEPGFTVFDHLVDVGIIKSKRNPVDDYRKYVKEVEGEFWKKLRIAKKWQERQWKFFAQHGYLETIFGFECRGYLSRNQILNFPVQGTGFHCLLYALNHIRDEIQNWSSSIIGQIHDNCIYDTAPDERENLIEITEYYADSKLREDYPRIIVPLLVEWEETDVNASWATKHPLKRATN